MKKGTNTSKKGNMKLLKFLLAALAGFGLVKLFGYLTEAELNEDEDYDIYDEEDHPLFV